jgi:biofilm PGA synthesis N-glycosyltransferase PgaC
MNELPVIALTSIIMVMGVIYLGYYLYLRYLVKSRSNTPAHAPQSERPHISVIVPTFNEKNTIEGKLEDLLRQKYPLDRMEVIVMDSGSKDGTASVVKSFADSHRMLNLRLITETERRGKSAALNSAFQEVSPKSEIVVITDSDSRFREGSLNEVVQRFEEPEVGLVTGIQKLVNPDESGAARAESTYKGFYVVLRQGESLLDSTLVTEGELLACRRDLAQGLTLRKDLNADDTQLAILARRNGLRSICDPNAVFYEFAPPDARDLWRQKVRRGQGVIRALWGNKDLLFNSTYAMFGMLIFPANFFMHIVSPIMSIAVAILALDIIGMSIIEGGGLTLSILAGVAISILILTRRTSPSSTVITFAYYQLILFEAILLALMGRSLHRWQKIESVRDRERWAKLDSHTENQNNGEIS